MSTWRAYSVMCDDSVCEWGEMTQVKDYSTAVNDARKHARQTRHKVWVVTTINREIVEPTR